MRAEYNVTLQRQNKYWIMETNSLSQQKQASTTSSVCKVVLADFSISSELFKVSLSPEEHYQWRIMQEAFKNSWDKPLKIDGSEDWVILLYDDTTLPHSVSRCHVGVAAKIQGGSMVPSTYYRW